MIEVPKKKKTAAELWAEAVERVKTDPTIPRWPTAHTLRASRLEQLAAEREAKKTTSTERLQSWWKDPRNREQHQLRMNSPEVKRRISDGNKRNWAERKAKSRSIDDL